MYYASDDEATIQSGPTNVKRILAENYVRPAENTGKNLSRAKQRESYFESIMLGRLFERCRQSVRYIGL